MKKTLLIALMGIISISAFSQDIYEVAELSTTDLNGTSRYVGMGGAMGALGGDLSVMSSNPAATGLYRRSDVAFSGSLVVLPGQKKFDGKHNKYISFDQLGFVYAMPMNEKGLKFINFGINYRKNHDFNQLVNAGSNNLTGYKNISQTWQMADLSSYWGGIERSTPLAGMANEIKLIGMDADGNISAYNAYAHKYSRARWGSNLAFDFNISTNIKDQFYIGLTASAYNVEQKSYSEYGEALAKSDMTQDGSYLTSNDIHVDGTGVDLKIGFALRPIKSSNFKIGLSFTTPTYYDLNYRNNFEIYANTLSYDPQGYWQKYDYDYIIKTPWKLNLSIGNTFFNRLAVGLEYEFADYSTCSVGYDDDDWDYWYWGSVTKDKELNRQTDKFLKSTHTLKAGAELMVSPEFFVRAGYNYVSSAFDSKAFLNQYINSASVDAATYTDYLNLSGINRFALGVGLKFGSFYADAAWLYQRQHGDLYTSYVTEDSSYPSNVGAQRMSGKANISPRYKIGLNRSQIMMTLGYRF